MNEYPGNYQTTTIKSIIQDIYHRELLIPDFKKEFVWNHEQIETLFDSIFKGYPIGTFLFWQNNNAAKFKLYDFIKDFSEFESSNYGTETSPNGDSFKTIIDGQQRLTALYIALKGTYAYHTKYTRIYDKTGYPPQKLFFLYCNYQTPHDKLFNFMDPAYATIERSFIELEAFLNYNSAEELINDIQEKYQKTIKEKDIAAIQILYNRINNDPTISYCTLDNELNDETLDIFTRTNLATTPLTKSELLISLTTSNWDYAEQGFSELIRDVSRIGKPGFIIDNDFILKCCFILTDTTSIWFNIDYMQKKIKSIKENWFNIRGAILQTFKLLKELGFNDISTKEKYAIIPIIYWINSQSPQTIDHNQIRKWLIYAYLNNINFDKELNIIKMTMRRATTETFPSEQINEYYRNIGRSHNITDDYIEKLLTSKHGSAQSWYLLLLLYPEIVAKSRKNEIVQDHIHPAVSFENGNLISIYKYKNHERAAIEDERSFALKYYDTVLNLQLLPAENNKNDTDLETWHNQNPEYNLYVDEGISLKLKNFRAFIENRKKNITNKLKAVLQN